MKIFYSFLLALFLSTSLFSQGDIYLTPDSTGLYIVDGMQPHNNGGFVYTARKCSGGCWGNEDDSITMYRKYASGPPIELWTREYFWWLPQDWEPQHLAKWNNGFIYMANNDIFELILYKLDSSGMIYDSLMVVDSVYKIPAIISATSDGGVVMGGTDWLNFDRSWVLKLDSNLNVEWTKYFPPNNNTGMAWTFAPYLEETPDSGFVWSWSGDGLMKISSTGTTAWTSPILPDIGIYDLEVTEDGIIHLLVYAINSQATFPPFDAMGILKISPSGVRTDSIVVNWTGYMDPYSYKLIAQPNGNYQIIEGDYDNSSINVQVLDSSGLLLDFYRNYLSFYATFWGMPEKNNEGGVAIHGYAWSQGMSDSYQGMIITVDSSGKIFPNLISGKLHDDPDGDCLYDSGENNLEGWFVNITSPTRNYLATTDSSGNYKISLPADNYTIGQIQHSNRSAVCPVAPASYSINFGPGSNTANNIDFSNQLIPGLQDVAVSFSNITPIRIAEQASYLVTIVNNGSITMNGSIVLTIPAQLTFDSASLSPANVTGNVITWNYSNLQYDEFNNIVVYLTAPLSTQIGDTLSFDVVVTPIAGDVNPSDNTLTGIGIVVGSFDPNMKTVQPTGWGTEGFIPAGARLTYTIFFQNTGNDTAFNIRITDVLDSSLDWTSFRFESSSHPCVYDLTTGGLMEFTFNNIMLPDSFVNEPLSHGFVKFSIDQNPLLSPYTEITNTANIYFDVNAPIVTNTTLNTIQDPNSISEHDERPQILVSPNPATDRVKIIVPPGLLLASSYFELYDMSGRLVLREQLMHTSQEVQRENLGSGSYLFKVVSDDASVQVGKLIFE
jgi:uncharacterized repeat protein (TIGR01451 family)